MNPRPPVPQTGALTKLRYVPLLRGAGEPSGGQLLMADPASSSTQLTRCRDGASRKPDFLAPNQVLYP